MTETNGSHSETGNGVRISNRQIYDLLLKTSVQVARVSQTVDESLVPQVKKHGTRLETKVDRDVFEAHVKKVSALEMRLYASIIGILAAVAGINFSGII